MKCKSNVGGVQIGTHIEIEDKDHATFKPVVASRRKLVYTHGKKDKPPFKE